MKTKKTLRLSSLLIFALLIGGCNKAILHSKDREMEPISRQYSSTSTDEALKATKDVLKELGYKIEREDAKQGTLLTGWLSTKASSHYVDLFDKRDYGTVGAYYRLDVHVKENGAKTEVEISAPVRSVVGRIRSAHSEEKKVLDRVADLLRKEDFEMTNVGVTE